MTNGDFEKSIEKDEYGLYIDASNYQSCRSAIDFYVSVGLMPKKRNSVGFVKRIINFWKRWKSK